MNLVQLSIYIGIIIYTTLPFHGIPHFEEGRYLNIHSLVVTMFDFYCIRNQCCNKYSRKVTK